MCDQTEVIYAPGDVVWVKLGPVWWPSQVQDYDKLPADITGNLRKRPIAVVKFFQEDAFEYVKNLDQIYHYNCRKKHEFIKKGLDMCRSSNRNVPSNMKMFPNDIATAEHLTHGDPDILNDPEFQPEEKEDYRELFGKKPAKKSKLEHTKEWRIRSLGDSAFKSNTKNGRQSLTPRAVTHPRFINKALGKGSDHEVRIRSQSNDILQSSGKLYNCHLCGFSASRINVIILHNKSHSAGYADAFLPSTPSSGKSKKRSLNDKRPKTSLVHDRSKSDEPPIKRKTLGGSVENKLQSQPSGKSQKDSKDLNLVSPSKNVSSPSPARKPIFGRKRTAKDKAEKAAKEKRQTEEFREKLLKDWDDDDDDNGSTGDKSDLVDQSADDKGDEGKTKTDDSKKTPTKETSCFDFDDSEDGIKPEETIMQFGRKIPRLLGDKKKRKSESEDPDDKEVDVEPKEISVSSEDKPMAESSNEEESIEDRKRREEKEENEKKAKEEFDMAFKALLEETVAPTIPDSFDSNKDKVLLGETSVNTTSSLIDDGIVPPDPPPEGNELINSEVVDVVEEVECVATEDNQNFLVKMSGEGAATSPDKDISETKITFCDSNNVAHPNAENFDQAKEVVAHVEEVVEQTTEVEEVVDFKVDETLMKTDEEDTKSLIPEENPADSSKCQGFLSNDFVDDCIVDNYSSIEQSAQSHQSSPKTNKTPQLNNESNMIEISENPKKTACESESAGFSQGDMQFIVVTSNANETSNVVTSMSHTSLSMNTMYQDMDFDIDSMPVIIGDDMTQEEQLQPSQRSVVQAVETTVVPQKVQKKQPLLPMLSSKSYSKPVGNKVVTVISSSGQLSKMSQGELKQVKKTAVIKKDQSAQPTMVRIPTTLDNKLTRKVILSPTKKLNSPIQSTAVRIAASTSQVGKLSVPGLVTQKGIVQNAGGSGQVLILKSAGPSTSTASKATLQKVPQMIQSAGGNKVLILTSTPGAAGQKVLGTLTSPQKTITSTRFITTTKGSVVVGKAGGNTCQKILIDKSGAISQAPKSVIIDKASLSLGSALSKNSTALLTSSNSIASLGTKLTPTGNSKAATTILASSSVAGKKGESQSLAKVPQTIRNCDSLLQSQVQCQAQLVPNW
ncbi:hypothetical protein LSTR_LSTR014681 [Laodelphax striatellus]|uniref:PWWP domain-containing protein n=1 Tax=Laodelphax striatellus TaxID=195883 RepID=A0A482XM06_LAOST|nr:hypothetical protein LSTR_LSTR014681 [Laodelphax striatellus]